MGRRGGCCDWLGENVWTNSNAGRAISAVLLIGITMLDMNKFYSFSVSLLGSSSLALASLPLGIGSATAQEAKTTQGTAADLGVMISY